MANAEIPINPGRAARAGSLSETWRRVLRFTLVRAVALTATVVVGVYLSILIANMGGYVDQMRKALIREQVSYMVQQDEEFRRLAPSERHRLIDELSWSSG